MSTLTVQDRDDPTAFETADAGGDEFINDGLTELRVVNGGLAAITVTAVADGQCSQGFLHDVVQSVAAGELFPMGPFTHSHYSRTDSRVQITYSDVTAVTVEARRLR